MEIDGDGWRTGDTEICPLLSLPPSLPSLVLSLPLSPSLFPLSPFSLRLKPTARPTRSTCPTRPRPDTYDFFCEKLGFKLAWGCLAFYPNFYCVGVWSLVSAPAHDDLTPPAAAAVVALFACGWVLTRGANLQKFAYKRSDGRCARWMGLQNRVVPGTRLLCSGFWGLARHVNYCGEIVQALALALPGTLVGGSLYYRLLPWAYPLYYVAILLPRQLDDDAQIRTKYGDAAFAEYVRRVPARVIPGGW